VLIESSDPFNEFLRISSDLPNYTQHLSTLPFISFPSQTLKTHFSLNGIPLNPSVDYFSLLRTMQHEHLLQSHLTSLGASIPDMRSLSSFVESRKHEWDRMYDIRFPHLFFLNDLGIDKKYHGSSLLFLMNLRPLTTPYKPATTFLLPNPPN
jgi:hypothetical protein